MVMDLKSTNPAFFPGSWRGNGTVAALQTMTLMASSGAVQNWTNNCNILVVRETGVSAANPVFQQVKIPAKIIPFTCDWWTILTLTK